MALKSAMAAIGTPLALAATEGPAAFDLTSVVSSSVTTVQSQLFTVLGVVVPAIVAVTAAVVGVKFAIGWLRKIRG